MEKKQLKDWRELSIKIRRVQFGNLEKEVKKIEVRKIDQLLKAYITEYKMVFNPAYPPE